MKSPEAATQVKAINDGFKAIGTLRFGNDPDVKKLIDGLQSTVQDKTVRIGWEASANDVWTVVEKAAKKAAEHFKRGAGKAKTGKDKKAADSPADDGT